MEPIRSLISLTALAALVTLGTGCTSTNWLKGKSDAGWTTPQGVPAAPLSSQIQPGANGIVQAGAISQSTSAIGSSIPSTFSWLTGKSDKLLGPKVAPVSIAVAWQNRVDYLPDPARQGEMGPGIAGQLFLFGSRDQAATADGTLIVELFDETPRPNGMPPLKPEQWTFRKDVLQTLRSVDERFGPNYVVFLPWPSYRPDVTRVRIKVRFDPEKGYPLYAEQSHLSLDTTMRAVTTPVVTRTLPMGATDPHAFGSEPHAFGETPPPAQGNAARGTGPGMGVFSLGRQKPAGSEPAAPNGTLQPAPPGYGTLGPVAPGAPAELPPLSPAMPVGPRP